MGIHQYYWLDCFIVSPLAGLSVSARHFSHVEGSVLLAFLSAPSLPLSLFPLDSGLESVRRRLKCVSMPLGIEQCAISVIGLRIWCTFACAWRHFQSHSAAARRRRPAAPKPIRKEPRKRKRERLKIPFVAAGPHERHRSGAEQRETRSCEPSRISSAAEN